MSFPYSNLFAPLYTIWPATDTEDFLTRINQVHTILATAINTRDISLYVPELTPNGQLFYPKASGTELRPAYRTLVTSAGITAAGTTAVAHNIVSLGNFIVTRVYGTLFNNNTAAPVFVPIPQAAPDDVAITVDGTNVNIIAATGTYNGWSAIVVLEIMEA